MTLAEYVTRVMDEKRLSSYDVEKSSGNRITDSYVLRIRDGKSQRPSVTKLRALAKGLGVDFDEILRVAEGLPEERGWTGQALAEAMMKIVGSDDLTQAVKNLLRMSPDEVRKIARGTRKRKA